MEATSVFDHDLLRDWDVQLAVVLATGYAMLLGGVIGYERELKDRPAGLRTHMLMAGAAALLVGLGDLLATQFAAEHYQDLVRIDPIRLIEAVVTGVAFIGAGTIIRRDAANEVSGLTTATSLLMSAAIGVAAGLSHYVLALGVALLSLVVLRSLKSFERRLERRREAPKD